MKVTIIHSEDCPHCVDLLQALKDQGGLKDKSKELRLVEATTEEGMQLAEEYDLEYVPTAINEQGLVCEITKADGSVDVICPSMAELQAKVDDQK